MTQDDFRWFIDEYYCIAFKYDRGDTLELAQEIVDMIDEEFVLWKLGQ